MSQAFSAFGAAQIVYGTTAGADAYLKASSHGATTWNALDSAAKQRFLINAARILERQAWIGAPTQTVNKTNYLAQPALTQPLQFPRTGLTDKNGVAVSSSTEPLQVTEASYELALSLAQSDATVLTQAVQGSNVKEHRLLQRVEGAVQVDESTSYFAANSTTGGSGTRFPTIVQELIGFWLAGTGGDTALSEAEIGAIDGCSSFEGADLGFFDLGLP